MDGWATLSILKSDPDLVNIPVIMMTILDDKNLGFTLGASDYITKPVDRDRLITALRKFQDKKPSGPILIVEDDSVTREMFSRVLVKDGWSVEEAENGRIALKHVAQHRPEAILLDLLMPEVDGFEFLSKLRSKEQWRNIPIIVVTGKDLTEQDYLRLNNNVTKIYKKGAYNQQELLNELRDQIRNCIDI
jgi:CheY-like chemotaxis protein